MSYEAALDQIFDELTSTDCPQAVQLEDALEKEQAECIEDWFKELDAMNAEYKAKGSEAFDAASPLFEVDLEKVRVKKMDQLLTEFQYNVSDEEHSIKIVEKRQKEEDEKEDEKKKHKTTKMTEREFVRWFQLMNHIIFNETNKESLVAKAIYLVGVLFRSQTEMIDKNLINPVADQDLVSKLVSFALDLDQSPVIRAYSFECLSRLLSSSKILMERTNVIGMENEPDVEDLALKKRKREEERLEDSLIFKIGWESVITNPSYQIQLAGQTFLLHIGKQDGPDQQLPRMCIKSLVHKLQLHILQTRNPEDLIKIADFVLKLASEPSLAVFVLRDTTLMAQLLDHSRTGELHRDLVQKLCDVLQLIPSDLLETLLAGEKASSFELIKKWVFAIWNKEDATEIVSMILLRTLVNIQWNCPEKQQWSFAVFSFFWDHVFGLLFGSHETKPDSPSAVVLKETVQLKQAASKLSHESLPIVFIQLIDTIVPFLCGSDQQLWRQFCTESLTFNVVEKTVLSNALKESHRLIQKVSHLLTHLIRHSDDFQGLPVLNLIGSLRESAIKHTLHPIVLVDVFRACLELVSKATDDQQKITERLWSEGISMLNTRPPLPESTIESVVDFLSELHAANRLSSPDQAHSLLQWTLSVLEQSETWSIYPLLIRLLSQLLSTLLESGSDQTEKIVTFCQQAKLAERIVNWTKSDDEETRMNALLSCSRSFFQVFLISSDGKQHLEKIGKAINSVIANEIDWEVQDAWVTLIEKFSTENFELLTTLDVLSPFIFDLVHDKLSTRVATRFAVLMNSLLEREEGFSKRFDEAQITRIKQMAFLAGQDESGNVFGERGWGTDLIDSGDEENDDRNPIECY